MKLLDILSDGIMSGGREIRLRDRRAFYASELTKDARDLFWKLTGEPETNPSDLVGKLRMGLGSSVEEYAVQVLKNSEPFGLKLLGTQVPIGGSEPVTVDGYLDGLVVDKNGQKYVVEIKTKWGWGATFFARDRDPGENYMAQMGYYLRDLSAKGVTNKGVFLFLPFSDDTFGDLIAIYCEYNPETEVVTAYSTESLNEPPRPLNITLHMGEVLAKLKEVEGYVQRGELPPVDKRYKYPVTPEYLPKMRDSDLKKAVAGEKIIGDWEISYSSYKQKHMQLQDAERGYTEEELAILAEELGKREVVKKAAANAKRAATIAAKKRA